MKSINPATEEVFAEYTDHDDVDMLRVLEHAAERGKLWRKSSFEQRAKVLLKAADILERRTDEFAEVMTKEMGKLLSASRSEVKKCATVCRYYARHGAQQLTPRQIHTNASLCHVRYDPLGVILGVMPWNFPLWQVFRFAAPTLMAGNTCLLKHAPNVPGCAKLITEVFNEAEDGAGLFAHLFIDRVQVETLLKHELIRGASVTGSLGAGVAVAKTCAEGCKPVVLELGGSDPLIVLEDADLDKAVEVAMSSRFQNNGQSCIAAKRFIVHQDVYDAFIQKLKPRIEALVVGDPMEESTDIGPMAREDLMDEIHRQVQRSIQDGARCLVGGAPVDVAKGHYYQPTLLVDVKPGYATFKEEVFGPAASVIKARDAEHAVEMANDSDFGLGASIWTKDMGRALELSARVESGNVFINAMVASDPRVPFGGIKHSGLGRELSQEGIRAFVNIKTVWVG
jgi:succinate-semialdehyde dehydrogenase/glutarate-semialdehyde dehydrogenase